MLRAYRPDVRNAAGESEHLLCFPYPRLCDSDDSRLATSGPGWSTDDNRGTVGISIAQLFDDTLLPSHRGPIVILRAMEGLPAAKAGIRYEEIAGRIHCYTRNVHSRVYGRAAIAGAPYRSVPRHHRQYFFGVDFEHEIIICVSDVNIAAGIYGHSGNDSGRRMCRGYWSEWTSKVRSSVRCDDLSLPAKQGRDGDIEFSNYALSLMEVRACLTG